MCVWGKLYRTDKMQKVLQRLNIIIANKLVFGEDLLIWSALLMYNVTVVGVDDIGYVYNVNNLSVTNNE